MRRLTSLRRRRRSRIARAMEDAAVRILSALWLIRLFVRHGPRYGR